jgi:hypothetical protein
MGELLMLLGLFSLLLITVNPILGMAVSIILLTIGGNMTCQQ